MTNEVIGEVMEKAIMWRWKNVESPWEQKRGKKMRIITTDGVGIHINPTFLQFLLDNHVRLVLRCPYSSSKTQPEDVTSFWFLKNNAQNGVYKAKQERLIQKLVQHPGATLDESDILQCTAPSWQATFTPTRIATGYAACGYKPNTRRPYWELLRKEKQAEKALAKAPNSEHASKSEELNFNAAVSEMASYLGVDEKAKKKASENQEQKRARLTSGDIALIPQGANGPLALPFAQLKASVGEIKGMNKQPCIDALKRAGADSSGELPILKAKLLLCSAMHYNLGRLPRIWVDGKGPDMIKIRDALGKQAALFLSGGFVERLPGAKRANARHVLNYWVEQASVNQSILNDLVGDLAAPTQLSAVTVLDNLFSAAPVPQASQAS